MASATSSVIINQPVSKVFSYITSVENHTTWQPGILSAQATPPGPIQLGTVYHYVTEVMGKRYETQTQVSAFELNKKWATKTIGVPKSVETVYIFEEGPNNTTRLTISMDLTGAYPAAAEGMIQKQMQKTFDEQALRLKQFAER